VIRSDIGVLNDLLVERTHLSTEKINFDPGQRVFTMPVGDVRGRRQRAELIDRSLITVEGVRAMDVRDEARIVFYDIVHVTHEKGSLTFTSNFPSQIELGLDPAARVRVETVNSS